MLGKFHLMQKPYSEMPSLRNLFQRNLLFVTKTKLFYSPHSVSSKPFSKCHYLSSFHPSIRRSIHSSNLSYSDVRFVYDPVTDSLVSSTTDSKEEEPSNGESDESSQERDEMPKSWSAPRSKVEKYVPQRVAGGAGSVLKKKSGKKISWVCVDCGESYSQWWGTCRSCNAVGTLKEFRESDKVGNKTRGFDASGNADRSWLSQHSLKMYPRRLTDVNKGVNPLEWRIPLSGLFGMEVARVLGGGLVPGSLVLVGGDPGVGKSTLLLQIAAILADRSGLDEPAPVIYVSGEESMEQIGNRGDRMRICTDNLYLYSSTDIEDILEQVKVLSPRALIVDSIQTVYLKGVVGSAGNIQQVKECTATLLRFAKQTNVPILLIGHVTKTGDIAGPRVLEHIVDAVLYLEGEKYSSYRLLRCVKNRFGSTDELGVFEMSQLGLQAVSNPSEIFLSEDYSESDVLAGLAVAVIIDGSRSFLIEIQALCSSGSTTNQFNGVRDGRAEMIISILIKQAGLKLKDSSIFLNVVSGFKLQETAGDLAVAAAICSSFFEFPIPIGIAFIGEIGLGGELRTVPRMDKRVLTVSKLGYNKCIIPRTAMKSLIGLDLENLQIVGCKNLKEVINCVFHSD